MTRAFERGSARTTTQRATSVRIRLALVWSLGAGSSSLAP
jgi:hypothetical protein